MHRGIIRIHPTISNVIEGELVHLQITREEGNIGSARVCYNIWPKTAFLDYDIIRPEKEYYCISWKHLDNKTHTISIQTIKDDIWENDEIFYVVLQNVEKASLDENIDKHNSTVIIQANNC